MRRCCAGRSACAECGPRRGSPTRSTCGSTRSKPESSSVSGREGGKEGGGAPAAVPASRIAPSALRRLRGGHPDRVRGEDGPVHSRLQESSAEDAGHPCRHPRHELQLASYRTGRCGREHLRRRARGRAVRPDGALRRGDGLGAAVPAGRVWAPSVGVRALSAGRPPLSARSRCAPSRGCR